MKNAYIPSRGIRKIPHLSTLLPEFHICKDGKGAEAVVGWGLRPTTHKARAFAAEHQLPFIALEDGFLRSLGLGVAGYPPYSIVYDDIGIYYDTTRPSRLEQLILTADTMPSETLAQARQAMDFILRHHLSKYNHAPELSDDHPLRSPSKPETHQAINNENQASFWAFEEGYFRPYYITLEKDGVNAFSPLPRRADFFLEQFPKLAQQEYKAPTPVRGGFTPMAKNAVRYYIELFRNPNKYPNYIHHRASNAGHYLKLWSISILKRLNYYIEDIQIAKRVEAGKYGKFFIVPLQVFNDSQVRIHCDFSSIRSFLLHVLASFAAHAPADTNLIIKHHPMDRGFIDYSRDIKRFIKKHPKLKGHITYVHDVPLPVFLRHGLGMVTINSTSGLSGLIHNMPVKVLGRAHYDIPGITDQNTLAEFWNHPTPPDSDLFHAYRMYHLNVTQINGNFYSQVFFPDKKTSDSSTLTT